MAPRLTWRRLIPGLIALGVIVAATVALLAYGSVGRVSGDTLRLYVVTSSARGVMRGTEVWLSGQRVGVVEDVGFRPPHSDTLARVVIAVDVREDDADQIRRDSDVRVRTGSNLIGPIVVYVSAGTPGSPRVENGDTLFVAQQSDLGDAMQRLGDATKQLDPLMSDARVVMSNVRNTNGTIGAFMQRGSGVAADLRARVGALREQLDGTTAERAAFVTAARGALAQVDSIRILLREDGGSLGRFRRDSSLGPTIASVRARVDTLRERLASNSGTLGRFAADSAIQRALADAQAEMARLAEDVRRRPLRYIAF